MVDHKRTLRDIVQYCTQHFIAEVPRNIYTFERGRGGGEEACFPITTTLLLLNSCLGRNTLLEGERGTGKTKSAAVIGTLVFQLPYEFLLWKKVTGIPGATINDIYATHDLAELNRGNDVAFLYLPFHAPFVNIDELNRYSELEQNRIREGISTGVWSYANHSWHNPDQVVVSAINPQSYGGTFILNDNLKDVYSLVLEAPHYNSLLHAQLVQNAERNMKEKLGLEKAVVELLAFYEKQKNDPKLIQERIRNIQEKMITALKTRGVPFIHNGSLEEIASEVKAISFEPEATLFFHSSLAEITHSYKYGQLRYDDPASDDTHDQAYAGVLLKESLAGRFLQDWSLLGQAIAWYLGKRKVGVEELKAAFVYTASHRLKLEEEFHQKVLSEPRKLPLAMECARQLIEKTWKNYSSLAEKQGFQEARRAIRILSGDEKGEVEDVKTILERVDHPLGRLVLEALE